MRSILLFAWALALSSAGALGSQPALAQTEAELNALNQRVGELYRAGNYAAAISLTERYLRGVISNFEKSLGPEHHNVATALNDLALLLQTTNRPNEAESLYRRALAIDEKIYGPDHPHVATDLNSLALLLKDINRRAEAEPLMWRALAIDEKSWGPEHRKVATSLNNLARLLHDTNRLAEAESLYRRALAIDEKSYGPDQPQVATALNNLALLLKDINRLAEAEPLMRRALAIDEKSYGPEHPNVALALNNLARLLQDTNRLAEAEQFFWRALAIQEKSWGPEHPHVAATLNNLAGLLQSTNRLAEAEPLYRRALAIEQKSWGPEHPNVANALNNLAGLLENTNRLAEAEPLYRRALAIDEKSYGPEHPNVAIRLNNLAGLLRDTNRLAEAEPIIRRVLAIQEKSYGRKHPMVARALNNLAMLLTDTNRLAEAEPLMRRALAIDEKSYGPEHPNVALALNNLAGLREEQGDWVEAAHLRRRAVPSMTAARDREVGGKHEGFVKAALSANTFDLRATVRAVYRAHADSAEAREEGFEVAQWALQTGAADALAEMVLRFAKGTGPLAQLVRQRQDLIARRQGEDRRLLAAVGAADAKATDAIRAAIAGLDDEIATIDTRLAVEFKEYTALSNPKPLGIAATQELLKPDEALVLFLDVPRFGKRPEESLVWVLTKDQVRWRSILLGTRALSDRVAALRCGLDASSWEDAAGWPDERALDKQRIAEQQARRAHCKQLLGLDVSPADRPPFDLAKAYELYQVLLAPIADLTEGKHLIIVPSGPLTTLPFHVLVTKAPSASLTGMARYRQAAWLVLEQPVTVLPSVGSLQALRKLGPSQAAEPYIAFGNPLLTGANGTDKRAWGKQTCYQTEKLKQVADSSRIAHRGVALRAINLAELRTQDPLPETADELCAVANALGSLPQEQETVWLGARATERNVKRLSKEGKLRHYKVVHFATHGLMSGESEAILKAKAEPALVLTPPNDGATPTELEEDDGLLTASEVAQLELDADWVVLSACNTAAGERGDAEALSGLARAFFYAKARALLVSHWYVDSGAAVKLTTKVFAELKADPKIGRAEALRRSMAELITKGDPEYAHPAMWAPFVLVGEGGTLE